MQDASEPVDATPTPLRVAELVADPSFDPYHLELSVRTRLNDPTMFVPRLPLELVDAIANEVDYDYCREWRTLGAMSIVCRAWVDIGRKRVWKTLDIITLPQLLHVISFLQESEQDGALVTGVGSLVKTVSICLELSKHEDEDEVRVPLTTIIALLDSLPTLEELELCLPSHLQLCWPRCHVQIPSLKKLHINRFQHHDVQDAIADLVAFLNIFEEINTVTVNGDNNEWPTCNFIAVRSRGDVRRQLDALKERGVVRTMIHSLVVTNPTMVEVLEVMRRSLHMCRLRSVNCSPDDPEEFSALCDFIHVLGDGLLDLTLFVLTSNNNLAFQAWRRSAAKVSACTSLRSLAFSVWVLGCQDDDLDLPSEWPQVVSVLSNVSSPRLTSIRLNLIGDPASFIDQFNASERTTSLASLLNGMPGLGSVLLCLDMCYSSRSPEEASRLTAVEASRLTSQSVEDVFRELVPRITKNGLLRVEDRLAPDGFRVLGNGT